MRTRSLIVCFGVLAALATGLGVGAAPRSGESVADGEFVQRFLRSGDPPLQSYRAVRHLEASTRGGKMRAELDALTTLDSEGAFHFDITREDGSALIRRRVLLAALLAEQRSRNDPDAESAMLTPANYGFLLAPGPEPGQVTLALTPKRRSKMLIDGSAIVSEADADLLRVEGRLAKSPSFWTRHVDVVRRYSRIEGIRVPVEMTSVASVRFVGASSFSMTYSYLELNGVPVLPSAFPIDDER